MIKIRLYGFEYDTNHKKIKDISFEYTSEDDVAKEIGMPLIGDSLPAIVDSDYIKQEEREKIMNNFFRKQMIFIKQNSIKSLDLNITACNYKTY